MAPRAMTYRILTPSALADWPPLAPLLGAGPWDVTEVSDGNLNAVHIVRSATASVCVKQALPYVRVLPSWAMPPSRAGFEAAYMRATAPHVGGLAPRLLHYDADLFCLVMECLTPHIILRRGLIEGRRYPRMAQDMGSYLARACFATSPLAGPFETSFAAAGDFAGNTALTRITVDLIFQDPYRESERNRHTEGLEDIAASFRGDTALKAAVQRAGERFLTHRQALLHGDLHTGSIMVTESETRVIDGEFCLYGPIGFDAGALIGNLVLAHVAQPGHAREADDRVDYRAWIRHQIVTVWERFEAEFLALWQSAQDADLYNPRLFADPAALAAERRRFMRGVFEDTITFAGAKMIRRILGFAHVADFEAIGDAAVRARLERAALLFARSLLVEAAPESIRHLAARLG